jgi:hypothetical protein
LPGWRNRDDKAYRFSEDDRDWRAAVSSAADRVEPVAVEFGDAVAVCEQLGRNSKIFLAGKK